MNTIEQLQQNAKDLAIAYESLWRTLGIDPERRVAADWNKIAVWANILKDKQASLGIELMSPARLDEHVENARKERDKCEAIMHGTIHEDGIPPHDEPMPQPSNKVRLLREKMGLWLVLNEDGSERHRTDSYMQASLYCMSNGLEVLSVNLNHVA